MKKLISFIVVLTLISAFVGLGADAAELRAENGRLIVSEADENGKLILAFYTGEMLVDVRLYCGSEAFEVDITAPPENADELMAFYWDMETIIPLSSMITLPLEETDEVNIMIKIGNKEFAATLYDNETAKAFKSMLPMTLNMSELNGNEKYYYLSDSLPTKTERVGTINAGDIMLYGGNCVVLFYETFNTSYSYTKIGHIDDVTGLKEAVGRGSVTVKFE